MRNRRCFSFNYKSWPISIIIILSWDKRRLASSGQRRVHRGSVSWCRPPVSGDRRSSGEGEPDVWVVYCRQRAFISLLVTHHFAPLLRGSVSQATHTVLSFSSSWPTSSSRWTWPDIFCVLYFTIFMLRFIILFHIAPICIRKILDRKVYPCPFLIIRHYFLNDRRVVLFCISYQG